MNVTRRSCGRAVRMYMPQYKAAAAAAEHLTVREEGQADVESAQRLMGALVNQRQRKRGLQSVAPHHHTSSTANGIPQMLDAATSLGMSAFLVHTAHQHRGAAGLERRDIDPEKVPHPARDLLGKTQDEWSRLDSKARVEWIRSTPQGSKVLSAIQQQQQQCGGAVNKSGVKKGSLCGDSEGSAPLPLPRVRALQERYAQVAVARQPRQPATEDRLHTAEHPAASRLASIAVMRKCCAAARRATDEAVLRGRRGARAADPFSDSISHVVVHRERDNDVANPIAASVIHWKVLEAGQRRRTHAWESTVRSMLVGDAGDTYVEEISELRARHAGPTLEDEGEVTPPAAVGHSVRDEAETKEEAAAGDTDADDDALSVFCAHLGIGSPRKAFVLRKLREQLDLSAMNSQATTATEMAQRKERKGATLVDVDKGVSLAQVRALAEKYSAEYDALHAQFEASERKVQPSPSMSTDKEGSTRMSWKQYKNMLVMEDVEAVKARLEEFRLQLPALKSLMDSFSK